MVSDTNLLDDNEVINKIVQHYNGHASIIKIREKLGNFSNIVKFQFNSVTTHEILKLRKNIGGKEPAGTGKIPPKLMKL